MSIINIISNDELTLVQGVNGLFFCEESWVTQSRAVSRIGKVLQVHQDRFFTTNYGTLRKCHFTIDIRLFC